MSTPARKSYLLDMLLVLQRQANEAGEAFLAFLLGMAIIELHDELANETPKKIPAFPSLQ